MEMQNVLSSLSDLCASPVAWAIFAVVAGRATWSAVTFWMCPLVHGTRRIEPDRARDTINARFRHSPRFLVAMLVGLTLAIGGLYALRLPEMGALALAALVFGAFILIVEPSRLNIEDGELRVVAASLDGEDARSLAQERLRDAHLERIMIEVALAAMVLAMVLTF